MTLQLQAAPQPQTPTKVGGSNGATPSPSSAPNDFSSLLTPKTPATATTPTPPAVPTPPILVPPILLPVGLVSPAPVGVNSVPTGPEPPSSPTGDAKEAATTPNAKSQKPDSSLSKKTGTATTPTLANPTLLTPALIAAVSVTAPTQLQAAPTDSKPTDLKLTESKPTDHSHPSVGKIDGVHAKDLPQDSDVEIKSVKALPDATTALTPATDQTQAAAPAAEADLVQPAQATPPQATPVQATPTQAAQPQTAQTTATVAPVATDEVQSTDKTVSTKPAKEDSLTAVKAITSPDSVGQAQASFQHSSGGGNHSGQSDHSDSKPAELSTAQNQSKNALVTQVVNKFETMMAARPKGGVVIQLNPKDLGSITLTMKTVGKSIDTQISATNADVRAALTGSSADLANSIQSRGYTVSGISVGGEAGSSFQSQTQSQNPNPRSSQPVASPVSGLDPVSQPNVFPLSTSTYKASAGVDLWI